jgi:hypothetical protein
MCLADTAKYISKYMILILVVCFGRFVRLYSFFHRIFLYTNETIPLRKRRKKNSDECGSISLPTSHWLWC